MGLCSLLDCTVGKPIMGDFSKIQKNIQVCLFEMKTRSSPTYQKKKTRSSPSFASFDFSLLELGMGFA
jgi:hypothetical protein